MPPRRATPLMTRRRRRHRFTKQCFDEMMAPAATTSATKRAEGITPLPPASERWMTRPPPNEEIAKHHRVRAAFRCRFRGRRQN